MSEMKVVYGAKKLAETDMVNDGQFVINESSAYGCSNEETLRKVEILMSISKKKFDKMRVLLNEINSLMSDEGGINE